jgi:hypothetical protein
LVVLTPAVPLVQQLGQAGPFRAGDDVANLAFQVLLRPNLLKGREIEVPITRLARIDPTPVKRLPANPGDDERAAHEVSMNRAVLCGIWRTTSAIDRSFKDHVLGYVMGLDFMRRDSATDVPMQDFNILNI